MIQLRFHLIKGQTRWIHQRRAPKGCRLHRFRRRRGDNRHPNTKQYYRLNETGALIWRGLENGNTIEDIVSEMQTHYEVTREHAFNERGQAPDSFLNQTSS